jgi:hypothetical protein
MIVLHKEVEDRVDFMSSFYDGFNNTIAKRFAMLKQDLEDTTTGKELVLSKSKMVQKYVDAMQVTSVDIDDDYNSINGYKDGSIAGQQVAIGLDTIQKQERERITC